MAQPQLKVSYFNGPGRGELIRLILAAGGIAFEDDRVERSAMAALRPKLPLGQVPLLTIDGTVYPQSVALARYSARLGGLYPNDQMQALKADIIVDTLQEVWPPLVEVALANGEDKTEKAKVMISETLPKLFGYIEENIQGKFVLGDTMSYADLYLFTQVMDMLMTYLPGFTPEPYAKIQSVIESVKANANVTQYLSTRWK